MDDEKGIVADAVFFSNYVESRFVPQLRGSFDFGVPLPWAHSSVWLRNAAGIAKGEANDVYANFFFGGFGNNYVDANRQEKRYREYDSFPGFEINELNGRRFGAQHGGVTFRPTCSSPWARRSSTSLGFAPRCLAVAAHEPRSSRRAAATPHAGGQVDLRFTVMHWYEMTLSVGYAVGYRGSERAGHE